MLLIELISISNMGVSLIETCFCSRLYGISNWRIAKIKCRKIGGLCCFCFVGFLTIFLTIISFFFSVLGATLQFTCGTPDGQLFLHHKYHPLHGCGTLCPLSGLAYHNWDPCGSPSSTGWHCSHYLHCHGNFLIKH